jgi:hypothetical protein
MSKNRELNEQSVDLMAEGYHKKYKTLVEAYEKGAQKTRIGESLSSFEIAALGQQLDQFEDYRKFQESMSNLGALGAVPQVASEVIVAANANSVIPLLASVQPVKEEHTIVYFKTTTTNDKTYQNTKGVISDPRDLDNPGDGTLGAARVKLPLPNKVSGTVKIAQGNIDSKYLPLRPRYVEVGIDGVGFGKDDGEGHFVAFGFEGTIDYATGAYKIVVDPTATITGDKVVTIIADRDVDSANEITKVQTQLQTTDITAEVMALATDMGHFASFAFQNRFGKTAIDEVATDLTQELTRVMNTRAVTELATTAKQTTIEFDRTPPTSVSYAEHKLSFVDTIAEAEIALHKASGANAINRIIVGSTAAATLRGMPDFVMDEDASRVAVGLYGYYDGIPVIRATNVKGVADGDMVCINNNDSNYFNAPLVYAPFMPLMVTNTVQHANNPFRNTMAAGVWAGIKTVNPNLGLKVKIKKS